MTSNPHQTSLSQLIMRALKFPMIMLVSGLILSSLDLLPALQTSMKWQYFISIANDVGNTLIALSVVLLFYLIMVSTFKQYEKSLLMKNRKTTSHVVSVVRKGLRIIFVYITVYVFLSIIELKHHSLEVIHQIIAVFFIGSIAWILLQIFSILEVYFYHQYSSLKQGSAYRSATSSYTKIHQVRNVAAVLVMVVAIASALMVFESVRSVGISILASAGFLTAIVGLAAQKTLSSMFAGIQLAFSQPFGIGDSVIVENELGTVEELTLSYVVVKIWDSRRVILPISYFTDKPFTNLSRDEEGIAGAVKMHVDFSLPIEPLRNELSEILSGSSFWDKRIGNLVVSNFKENSVELTIKISSNNSDNLSYLSNEVREKLLEFINRNYPECFPKFRLNGNNT